MRADATRTCNSVARDVDNFLSNHKLSFDEFTIRIHRFKRKDFYSYARTGA